LESAAENAHHTAAFWPHGDVLQQTEVQDRNFTGFWLCAAKIEPFIHLSRRNRFARLANVSLLKHKAWIESLPENDIQRVSKSTLSRL